ncbi:uncharacterized protein [Aegilops tauschii subsp. strangulata]|uniref:uncharacterized protein isoform X4 n=1 Tax=Aegilops tauschii subsp. strangulata TaxID=200361 RepID=UPI003CC87E78
MGMEDEDQGEGEQDGHGEGVARPEIQRRSSRSGGPTITPDRWLLFLIPNLGYLMKKRRGRILRKSPEQGETSLVDPVFGTIHWEQKNKSRTKLWFYLQLGFHILPRWCPPSQYASSF